MIMRRGNQGLIVSCGHVCGESDTFEAYWPSVNEKRVAKTVGVHHKEDLAFLVVDDPPVAPVKLGLRDSHIIFAGFPAYDRVGLHWQYGNVLNDVGYTCQWRNTVVPGMSGGAVFDRADGDLCGIVKAMNGAYGFGVSDLALLITADKYTKEEWIVDSSHVKENLDFGPGAEWPEGVVVTKDYEEEEAPEFDE